MGLSESVCQSHLVAVVVSTVELLSLGLSLHNGVHGLQVRGVCHQRQGDVPVGHTVDATMVHSQMVLHISRALRRKTQQRSVQAAEALKVTCNSNQWKKSEVSICSALFSSMENKMISAVQRRCDELLREDVTVVTCSL